ncbi:MAG TPA: hypothetical protein VNK89_05525 [Thermoflexus sp.]|nr:hypothetical protein [Thermoflexus sp.]
MRSAMVGLLLMLFAIAFGITGAIWVGIRLGGWGLAVMVGVALGLLIALALAWRISRPDPYGASFRQGSYPGWTLGGPGIEGYTREGGYGFSGWPGGIGVPGRERLGMPFGFPFPGIPWVSWIAWIPGLYPTPPAAGPREWPFLPPPSPRRFTVIGEEEEE